MRASSCGLGVVLGVVAVVGAAACGTSADDGGTTDGGASTGGSASGGSGTTKPPGRDDDPPPPVIAGGDCESGDFEVRDLGDVSFDGEDYDVTLATPCEYVLSHVQKDKDFPITETETFYVVESDFELPYIPGVTDDVAYTPGEKNRGWAIGHDVAEIVADIGPAPFLYHVRPGTEYGYFTDYDDDQGDIFGAFRPTWRFSQQDDEVSLLFFEPPDTAWPRHRGGWNPREINQEIGFGLWIDEEGRVYVPKDVPLARRKWDDELRCVIVNRTTEPVPVTRTQFPGDESYYMAETILPGQAAVSSPGHLYWGHKGKKMVDVAKWDDTLPGNFDKPFIWGCSSDGYNVGHAEGFTWPKLREEKRDAYLAGEIDAIPEENLYKLSVYRQQSSASEPELQGEIHYEWDGDEWLPRASGEHLIEMDGSRPTHRISGYLPAGQRAFIVIDEL